MKSVGVLGSEACVEEDLAVVRAYPFPDLSVDDGLAYA